MSVVAVASLHGAPGATTLAAALASIVPGSVLIEADPSGGVLAARCGVPREPGLLTLAADRDGDLSAHVQQAGGMSLVPAPESAEQASLVLRSSGAVLGEHARTAAWAFVDVGRLGVDDTVAALLDAADALLLVCEPTVEQLAVLAARLPALQRRQPFVVLVGDRPYGAADVARELGVDAVTVVARDSRAVEAMWSGGRSRALGRSAFARSVQALADDLSRALVREPAR